MRDFAFVLMLGVAYAGCMFAVAIGLSLWSDLARERRLRKWRREHGYPSPNDKSPR